MAAEKEVRRIERHLFRVARQMVNGQWSVYFLGRFQCWDGSRFEQELARDLKTARDVLREYESLNAKRAPTPLMLESERQELERKRQEQERRDAMTISRFVPYEELTKDKRSADRDAQHLKHIIRLKGDIVLSDVSRHDLIEYRDKRRSETLFRCGEWTKVPVKDGTIRNELSCWRHLMNVAVREKDGLARRGIRYEVATVSFDEIMPDAAGRSRVLSDSERPKLLKACAVWLRRLLIVALETALSRGDLLRLRWQDIDFERGVIVPEGGRLKTSVEQVSPLTPAAREVFDAIRRERRRSKVTSIGDLVFTREDGTAITGDMIDKAMVRACNASGVNDFRFHDTRHCAKTDWARRGVGVEATMKAAGHASVEMHKRYVHLQRSDVAKAFGTAPVVDRLRNETKGRSSGR